MKIKLTSLTLSVTLLSFMTVLTKIMDETVLYWKHTLLMADRLQLRPGVTIRLQNFKKREWKWLILSVKHGMSEEVITQS